MGMDTLDPVQARPVRQTRRSPTAISASRWCLQGGGALGAYQGGVYHALSETGIEPNWVSGVSIGAINSSIIAGNKLEDRLTKLRQFWETISGLEIWAYTPDGDSFARCATISMLG
jgi:NTE family protein